MDEIAKLVNRSERKWGRKRWGRKWMRHQGQVGSCNCYAAILANMRIRDIKGLSFVDLSPEYMYCMINGGRDQGSMLDDGMEWMTENGTCPADMVPHQTWQQRELRPETHNEASRFRILEPYRVDSEMELASGLALGFVGVIAVHANNQFMQLDNDGVVASTDGPGNHAVGVDDVRIHSGELQFDMFNSWGTNYGQGGRGWVSWRRHLRTTSRYHAFYLIRSATDDPQGESAPSITA